MIQPFQALKKVVVSAMSACLLCLAFGCLAVCFHHIDEVSSIDAQSVAATCEVEECSVISAVLKTMPERPVLSPALASFSLLKSSADSITFARGSFDHRSFPNSHSPPFERFCLLRI
jgi:hypothetical protein